MEATKGDGGRKKPTMTFKKVVMLEILLKHLRNYLCGIRNIIIFVLIKYISS